MLIWSFNTTIYIYYTIIAEMDNKTGDPMSIIYFLEMFSLYSKHNIAEYMNAHNVHSATNISTV
jgi:hypothetical protein